MSTDLHHKKSIINWGVYQSNVPDKESITDMLMKNGANSDLRDKAGRTAFEDAEEKG